MFGDKCLNIVRQTLFEDGQRRSTFNLDPLSRLPVTVDQIRAEQTVSKVALPVQAVRIRLIKSSAPHSSTSFSYQFVCVTRSVSRPNQMFALPPFAFRSTAIFAQVRHRSRLNIGSSFVFRFEHNFRCRQVVTHKPATFV
jgi:hypothetical protein